MGECRHKKKPTKQTNKQPPSMHHPRRRNATITGGYGWIESKNKSKAKTAKTQKSHSRDIVVSAEEEESQRLPHGRGRLGSSSSSAVGQSCLDPQSTCYQELGVRCRSSAVPHSLLVVDSSCGHNWCFCCRQTEQSWRMYWTVCFASLQSQSAESMMPICFMARLIRSHTASCYGLRLTWSSPVHRPPPWPCGKGVRLGRGRSGIRFPLAPWGFFRVESYQRLKNWHSSGSPARFLAL